MLPDRVSNPGHLTYELGALPIALRGPAHKLFAYMIVSTVSTDIVSSYAKYCRIAYGITRSRMHCKVQMNE